jgi:hypothetical protein
MDEIATRTGLWEHRYALSDSVFLTHRDPATALRLAGDLMFNLSTFGLAQGRPTLVRGGMTFGEVEHVRNVFLTELTEPANLVGSGVLEAIELEGTGKGPRVFVGRELAARVEATEPALVQWLIREDDGGASELLWLLPAGGPGMFSADEEWIASVCAHAGRLYEQYGNEPQVGSHYEEFVLLAARSIARAFAVRDRGRPIRIGRRREDFFEFRADGAFLERLHAALRER